MYRRQFLATSASVAGCLASQPSVVLAQPLERLTSNVAAATVHPLATAAAIEIMHQGGNSIDAAIAAALVLGVVDGHNSGIGGGCLILARVAGGRILAIDGRETAGAAASESMFVQNGKADANLSQTGPLACGVPGQIAAMHRIHREHGKRPWKELFARAIAIADDGSPLSRSSARTIASEATDLARFPASQQIYFHPNGEPLREGESFVQKDLARTLQAIANDGPAWFYDGEFARVCAEYLHGMGGILTREDFLSYQPVDREPIETPYRGRTVIGFPPPSSGGTHIAQMLMMLEPYPIAQWYREHPIRFFHLLAECMKRAFADRAFWLGDGDFVKIPAGLLDPAYNRERMKDFSESSASPNVEHGLPPGAELEGKQSDRTITDGVDGKHTTHLTTADRDGNWVAMTCTVNTSWGSKVTVPGTGVMLNNQMDDFSIAPGTPNAFGLVGSQANAIAPRKRPLSSMSPTIVLDDRRLPVMTCGAAGGPRIINATLQVLVRTIDLEQSITAAIAAPRIHHQWQPDQLVIEDEIGRDTDLAISASIRRDLETLGHSAKTSSGLAVAQGIQRLSGKLIAAHDPRAQGDSSSSEL
ncbi:MAG: gamma-glutamyltransferase [Planctomycetota bacterium]